MINIIEQMKLFLEPKSVALIGVPRRTGRGSFNVLESLLSLGFSGEVYPVNPHAREILGKRVYQDVKELPKGVDLAIIMVYRSAVPGVVKDCVEKGIKALIIVSGGFAEADAYGKELQADVVRIAKEGGARIIGPNSLGIFNNFRNFSSTFLPPRWEKIPVALISQSGGFLEGFWNFTVGKAIDLGNMCDVDFSDALEYLENDPEIKVIAMHIEGIRDGRRFLKVAERVSRKKPILAIKPGRGEVARQTVASHTGSLSGEGWIYEAAFKKCGLIRVENVDELGDFVQAILYLPFPKGNKLAIITPTGAGAVMALDGGENYGFQLAQLSAKTINKIKEFFPPWSPPLNPIDMMSAGIAHGYGKVYRASLEALLEDEGVDAVLCIAGSPTLKSIKSIAEGKGKPVMVWLLGKHDEEMLARIKEANYSAVFSSPERAIKALAMVRDNSLE
jgi:acetyltransferase